MARGTKKGNKGAKIKMKRRPTKKVRKSINMKGGGKSARSRRRARAAATEYAQEDAARRAQELAERERAQELAERAERERARAAAQELNLPKLEELEAASIATVSFVPNAKEIKYLIKSSIAAMGALKDIDGSEESFKLSKTPSNPGLVPKNRNPNDTILAKLGRGDIGPGGEIGDKTVLTVINDQKIPLLQDSNGPNGVLTDCQNKYGKTRINLFHENEEQTSNLLKDYLKFRNENIKQIFDLYVDKMLENEKDGVVEQLGISEQVKEHYRNVCYIMDRINLKLKILEQNKLSDFGIGVVSYCQSWLRRGYDQNGNAHFSVMSPHFQTRFYIKDESKLRNGMSEDNEANIDTLIDSYRFIIERFTAIMQKDYGSTIPIMAKFTDEFQWEFEHENNYQAFINLDRLADQMGTGAEAEEKAEEEGGEEGGEEE